MTRCTGLARENEQTKEERERKKEAQRNTDGSDGDSCHACTSVLLHVERVDESFGDLLERSLRQ